MVPALPIDLERGRPHPRPGFRVRPSHYTGDPCAVRCDHQVRAAEWRLRDCAGDPLPVTDVLGAANNPVIVVVDDELDEMSAMLALLKKEACEVLPRGPDDVTADDLEAADLVL